MGWWIRNHETIEYIERYKHNPRYLSSVELHVDQLEISTDIGIIIKSHDIIIMAVPAAFLEESLKGLTKEHFENKIIFLPSKELSQAPC